MDYNYKKPLPESMQTIGRNLYKISYEAFNLERHFHNIASTITVDYCNSFEEDLHRIFESIQSMKMLCAKYLKECEESETSLLKWRESRQNLRIKASAIRGYCEAILLNVNGFSGRCVHDLKAIIAIIISILPYIAKLFPQTSCLQESQIQDSSAYTSCFVGLSTKSASILIIDPSQEKRSMLKRLLSSSTHRIYEAETNINAHHIIEKEPLDLILLDMDYAEKMQFEFLSRMKQGQNLHSDIPVLLIAYLFEEEKLSLCLQRGAEDYIQMPMNMTLFLARINSALRRRQYQQTQTFYQQQVNFLQQALNTTLTHHEDGYLVIDQKGGIVSVNKSALDMYPQLKQDELSDLTYRKFLERNLQGQVYNLEEYDLDPGLAPDKKHEAFIQEHLGYLAGTCRHFYIDFLKDKVKIEVSVNHFPDGGALVRHRRIQ